MTNAIVIGRLVKSPELKTTPSGTTLTSFSLAVADGKNVDFLDCTAYDKLAELIVTYKKQGDLVAVTGKIKKDKWKTQAGKSFSKVYILVNEIEFLGGNQLPVNESPILDDEEDLPF